MYTKIQLNNLLNKYRKETVLSIAHVNVRSLNANHDKLAAFHHFCSVKFDVIILLKYGRLSVNYYVNLFNNYSFFTKLHI